MTVKKKLVMVHCFAIRFEFLKTTYVLKCKADVILTSHHLVKFLKPIIKALYLGSIKIHYIIQSWQKTIKNAIKSYEKIMRVDVILL